MRKGFPQNRVDNVTKRMIRTIARNILVCCPYICLLCTNLVHHPDRLFHRGMRLLDHVKNRDHLCGHSRSSLLFWCRSGNRLGLGRHYFCFDSRRKEKTKGGRIRDHHGLDPSVLLLRHMEWGNTNQPSMLAMAVDCCVVLNRDEALSVSNDMSQKKRCKI